MMMNKQIISNIEQARNWAHAGDVEKMSMHLDKVKAEKKDEGFVKLIEIVEKYGKAIHIHHRLLDDAHERLAKRLNEKEKDQALMALKYAKFGLLDMMSKQLDNARSTVVADKNLGFIDFIEVTGHKISCYRDLITSIVNVMKNNNQIAAGFLQSAAEFSKKSSVDVKEDVKMIRKMMK
jgi:hypothetical protein